MADCKDCAHYEVCTEHHKVSHDWDARICHFFKDKSKFIELPNVDIGQELYFIDRYLKKVDSGTVYKLTFEIDDFYAWHISNLVIYDEPKDLSEFSKWDDYRPCENKVFKCKYESFDEQENCNCCGIDFDGTNCPYIKVQRPPQSWFYVKRLEK